MPPCHGGGHGFESRPGRHLSFPLQHTSSVSNPAPPIRLDTPSPLRLSVQHLNLSWLDAGRVALGVLRTDLVDTQLSGNKYYKLQHNLDVARCTGHHTVLSFGGAWSNHLHALAAAGQRFGFRTIGVVRGEAEAPRTACLLDAEAFGMQLHFVSRAEYRERQQPEFIARLQARFGPCCIVPEGGANALGVRGCQALLPAELAAAYDHVVLACGTGTTMLGLISSIPTPVIGIQVLKGAGYLEGLIRLGLQQYGLQAKAAWQVHDRFHRGGYAKVDAALLAFVDRLEADSGIPLEPVYIGKALMALQELIQAEHFAVGARVLVVHGGGLQGRRGFK